MHHKKSTEPLFYHSKVIAEMLLAVWFVHSINRFRWYVFCVDNMTNSVHRREMCHMYDSTAVHLDSDLRPEMVPFDYNQNWLQGRNLFVTFCSKFAFSIACWLDLLAFLLSKSLLYDCCLVWSIGIYNGQSFWSRYAEHAKNCVHLSPFRRSNNKAGPCKQTGCASTGRTTTRRLSAIYKINR